MSEKKASDHILSLVKAGLNLDPYGVGGMLSSLIGDYLPSSTERSVKELARHLVEEIKRIDSRIDSGEIDQDEFTELFKSAYLVAVRTHRQEKIHGAAHLLANLLLKKGDPEKLSYTELDHFVRAIDALSHGALHVHGVLVRFALSEESRGQAKPFFHMTLGHLGSVVGGEDLSLLSSLLRELASWGFTEVRVPQVNSDDLTMHTVVLTDMGKRFAKAVALGKLAS
jgi:hypothetical protein